MLMCIKSLERLTLLRMTVPGTAASTRQFYHVLV